MYVLHQIHTVITLIIMSSGAGNQPATLRILKNQETCKLEFFLIMDVQLGAWANHSYYGRFKCRSGAAS